MNATMSSYILGADDESFFVVCGVNHTKTGKAVYTNFAVRDVISVDDSKYNGSANKYAPNLVDKDMLCKRQL